MDLDDLKHRWQDQDPKLDARLRLDTRRLQAVSLAKAMTSLRRLSLMLKLETVLDLLLLFWLGRFAAGHAAEARFLIPAAALGLGVILLLASGIHQLVALGRLDYGEPVLALQKRVEALRFQRVRDTWWTLLLSPLAWIPLLIVTLKSLLGVDVYALFDGAWIAANLLFGLALIPLGVWLARRYAGRVQGSPRLRGFLLEFSGYNLKAAADSLRSLARFEQEENPA